MSRPQYYSPALKRHLVTALYHEAKRQGRPRTHLASEMVETALRELEALHPNEHGLDAMVLHESPPAPSPEN
jgi:hypothetical protein